MPKGYQFWLPKFWLPNLVLYQTDNLIYQSWRWLGYISIQISDLFLHTFSRKRPENFMDGRKDSWPDKRLKGLVGRKRMWSLTMWKLILSPKPSSWESYSISSMKTLSYTLGREYRVMRNRYSRLLFTSEDRLCANLRAQEQSTNMTS